MGPVTTYAGGGGRPGSRIWPRSHSGSGSPVGRNLMISHGSSAGGAWRDKSETLPSPLSSMIPGSSQSLRLKDPRDYGSGAGGAWRARSEAAPSAAARPRPARTRDITGLRWTNRANRALKQPQLMIRSHDHGSGGGGAAGFA